MRAIITKLIQGVLLFLPRYRRIADRNLRIAFPESSTAWRQDFYHRSLEHLAQVIVDFMRLPRLDATWVKDNVEGQWLHDYRAVKAKCPGQGVLVATGHLGSFELLAHCMPMVGHPISFVVRSFKLRSLDRWWKSNRERYGNEVIDRKGAFKVVIERLRAGRDVALLFDQNVTANHAVFVPWFGKLAATSKTLAIAAIRCRAPVFVAGIVSLPQGRYRVVHEFCDYRSIYEDESIPGETKVERITADLSARYERIIRMQPEAWFWLHRRWRTRPPSDAENPYA